jgi:hypothetical protein
MKIYETRKYPLIIGIALVFLAACALFSCSNSSPTSSLPIAGYNHTNDEIADFVVRSPNSATSGGLLRPGDGGGSITCCVNLPTIWHEQVAVTIRRITYDGKNWKKVNKVVKVPKYDMTTAGYLNVNFLRDGTIKVYATNMSLWNKRYPLKGLEAQLKDGVPINHIGE